MTNASMLLRIAATLCFLLGLFGVSPGGFSMMYLGLALWCGSTLVP